MKLLVTIVAGVLLCLSAAAAQVVGASGSAPPPDAPVIAGSSDRIVSGGLTLTLSEPAEYGHDLAGRPWVVVPPGGLQVVSRSPAPATAFGGAINGTERTPLTAVTQGFDHRFHLYDPELNIGFPFAVQAGDIVVGAISDAAVEDWPNRWGVVSEYAAVYFVSEPWPANALGPTVSGWPGRPKPEPYLLDVDALLAALPRFRTAGIAWDAGALGVAQRQEIAPARNDGPVWQTGYEQALTRGAGAKGRSNYGQDYGHSISHAGLQLISDRLSEQQRRDTLIGLIRLGVEMIDRAIATDTPIAPGGNGGHYQFHFLPVALALHATGRPLTLMDEYFPGNILGQSFFYTEDMIADLLPHDDLDRPYVSRRRQVTGVSGNTVTVGFQRAGFAGDAPRTSFEGLEMVRESDGATALVDGHMNVAVPANTTSTFDVPIDAQPDPPFAAGQTVFFRAPWEIEIGDADWRPAGQRNLINPSRGAVYRGQMRWTGQVLALKAMGIWSPTWDAALAYVKLSHDTARGYAHGAHDGAELAFWNRHAASILKE